MAYSGFDESVPFLLKGLKHQEYRGYDSAGVCVLAREKSFSTIKSVGALSNLDQLVKQNPPLGSVGLGHTRWATHGAVSAKNAHPHTVGAISVVHNGIIENYKELKQSLPPGVEFVSETDSEILSHLLHHYTHTQGLGFLEAGFKLQHQLQGTWAVCAASTQHPDALIAFKNSAPLIIGQSDAASFVASDATALQEWCDKIYYLDDNELAWCSPKARHFYKNAIEVKKQSIALKARGALPKKTHKHFMLQEIYEGPQSLRRVLSAHTHKHRVRLRTWQQDAGFSIEQTLRQAKRLIIVACGSSYYAALYAKYLIEEVAGVPVQAEVASELRYRKAPIAPNSVGVFISQSGETADTLACAKSLKNTGAPILSLCNAQHSSLVQLSHCSLDMCAGTEIGVASTKSMLCTLSLLQLVALLVARLQRAKPTQTPGSTQEPLHIKSMQDLPTHIEGMLSQPSTFELGKSIAHYKGFLFLGRGVHYPMALEGALKLKEIAYKMAHAYPAGEMKHGPLALIDADVLVVALNPGGASFNKTLNSLNEIAARHGHMLGLTTPEHKEALKPLCKKLCLLPQVPPMLMPLVELVALQCLAYSVALALGRPIDKPRNLAKSVTVE